MRGFCQRCGVLPTELKGKNALHKIEIISPPGAEKDTLCSMCVIYLTTTMGYTIEIKDTKTKEGG